MALAVLALVPAIYSSALPPITVVRANADAGGHVLAGIGQAATLAALAVAAAAMAAGSPLVLVIGGAAVAAYACLYAHAREVR